MPTEKVFLAGESQAVRIPKRYRFRTSEVNVQATPDGLLFTEKSPWELFDEGIEHMSDALLADRKQPPPEKRTIEL